MVSDRATQWSVVMWLPTGQRVWMVSEVVSVNKAGGGGYPVKEGVTDGQWTGVTQWSVKVGVTDGQWWGYCQWTGVTQWSVKEWVTVNELGLPNGQWRSGLLMVSDGVTVSERGLPNGQWRRGVLNHTRSGGYSTVSYGVVTQCQGRGLLLTGHEGRSVNGILLNGQWMVYYSMSVKGVVTHWSWRGVTKWSVNGILMVSEGEVNLSPVKGNGLLCGQ